MNSLRTLYIDLNGRWHAYALGAFMAVVIAHIAEHAIQAVQVFALGWERPEARGLLGQWLPWLVESESLHYLYAIVTLAGILLLMPAFAGRARHFWSLALVTQFWHHFEHALLLVQEVTGQYFFGGSVPTSVVQAVFPRVELHLFYNAVVFVPMLVAYYFHFVPLRSNTATSSCGCAWRRVLGSQRAN